jgi:hypothetical protein
MEGNISQMAKDSFLSSPKPIDRRRLPEVLSEEEVLELTFDDSPEWEEMSVLLRFLSNLLDLVNEFRRNQQEFLAGVAMILCLIAFVKVQQARGIIVPSQPNPPPTSRYNEKKSEWSKPHDYEPVEVRKRVALLVSAMKPSSPQKYTDQPSPSEVFKGHQHAAKDANRYLHTLFSPSGLMKFKEKASNSSDTIVPMLHELSQRLVTVKKYSDFGDEDLYERYSQVWGVSLSSSKEKVKDLSLLVSSLLTERQGAYNDYLRFKEGFEAEQEYRSAMMEEMTQDMIKDCIENNPEIFFHLSTSYTNDTKHKFIGTFPHSFGETGLQLSIGKNCSQSLKYFFADAFNVDVSKIIYRWGEKFVFLKK